MKFFLLLVSASLLGAALEVRADWPMFRGPNTSGVSETSLPVHWSRDENLRWATPLPGVGSSSPVISGEAVFATSYTIESGKVMRHLTRLNFETGEILWTRSVPPAKEEDELDGFLTEHGYASNTPVTDGSTVYAFLGRAGVFAFDFQGNRRWEAKTGDLPSPEKWGSGSSPVFFDDLLIIPAGEEAKEIFALDKATGDRVWTYRDESLASTYGTPIFVRVDDKRTDLVFGGTEKWLGLDPSTGQLRWFARYNIPSNMSVTTHHSGEFLTISGGHPRNARVAIRIGGEGDRSSELLYDTMKPTGDITTPVEVDGVIYWIPDSGIAYAALPGKAGGLWQERVGNLGARGARGKPFYASPIVAGGLIYVPSRANGTFVIEPSREGLKILAQNRIDGDDSFFQASPAASRGTLFLRSQTHLYAISDPMKRQGRDE